MLHLVYFYTDEGLNVRLIAQVGCIHFDYFYDMPLSLSYDAAVLISCSTLLLTQNLLLIGTLCEITTFLPFQPKMT
jgi:hypothetical protein